MQKRKINLLILLSLIGLAISLYLTIHHFKILTQGFTAPSFCSMGGKFDCDVVNMSSFSKFGPFPVAGLGMIYFFYLLLASIYARLVPESAKAALSLPFFMSIPAFVFSIYLGGISSFILGTWCIFCISLYLINIVNLILFYKILGISFLQTGSFFMNYLKKIFGKANTLNFEANFWSHALFALVVISISSFILYSHEHKYAADFEDFDHKAYLDFFYVQKPLPNIEVKGHPLWGKEGAPVTIVEFSDFECPFCKKAALNLKPRLKEFEKNVAFYFFNYPLDKSCNPYMQRDLHEHACDAAKAVLCAQVQGKFWPYHDILFENQPKFSMDQLKGYAQRTGLDVKKFEECLSSEETKNKVLVDIEAGKTIGLQGTPMVILNGRVLKDWYNPVVLKLLIEEEIKRNKKK